MEYMVAENPDIADVNEITDGLMAFNRQFTQGAKSIDVAGYSYDSNGDKTGGIVGQMWGNWLTIKYLWVREDCRGNGVGSTLLSKLEEYAASKGCVYSFLDTFSFQARPFYEKFGYECQMTLENIPISTKRYYMTRRLIGAGS